MATELEEEQAQETDLYQFSSDGAEKQPKTAKRATTATKQGKPAVNKTASRASKKTNAAARSKRKRQDGAATDLSDVFDAVGREIGLIHDSDDDNTRANTAVEEPTEYAMADEPVEPTTFTRPAKKRRSARPQARAPTALFVDSTATMSQVPVSDDVMASTVAGYCQAVSADVQDTAERAHKAYKQHAKAADTILAALVKSAHTNYSPLFMREVRGELTSHDRMLCVYADAKAVTPRMRYESSPAARWVHQPTNAILATAHCTISLSALTGVATLPSYCLLSELCRLHQTQSSAAGYAERSAGQE